MMATLQDCKAVSLQKLGDNRGNLVVVENKKDIPFNIQRIFYIYGCDGFAVRGKHANRLSSFVFICLRGSVKLSLFDGNEKQTYLLKDPTKGIYIPPLIWKEMFDFSSDSLLLVLSDYCYSANEYIRDFDDYLALQSKNR